MPKHIPPFDNRNLPLVEANNPTVPSIYFNRIVLKRGERYSHELPGYESAVNVAGGTVSVAVENSDVKVDRLGIRKDVWEGDPEAFYVPTGTKAEFEALTERCELYVAGGKSERAFEPFPVFQKDVFSIQYGSDATKTHRQIKHVLGKNFDGRVERLLVSELFTVGEGGWSGFPSHKHDANRPPVENRFEEAYHFRFHPKQGFGAQFGTLEGEEVGEVFHVRDGSTFLIDYGYHPCVSAPGYRMYYFTILVGETGRSLIQYFHPDHAHQVETIPGIKDMIAGFK